MKNDHVYLVNIESLSPDDRREVERLLKTVSRMVTIRKNPLSFIVYTDYNSELFSTLKFPSKCTWKDITGFDLLTLYNS